MNTLLTLMTYKRGHDTESEAAFTEAFIDPIPGMKKDAFGNRILIIGKKPKTLFSAHLDTVHKNTGIQKIVYDRFANIVYKDDGEPLGADNAAGIWILLNLIIAKVPGLYIFHRAEECGGRGSKHIATNTPELLKGIKRAVAFDRRGYNDVITHQRGGLRGCSDEFAMALGSSLGMYHEPCAHGSFTDTANYFHLIPECTNVSVGYHSEHTSQEWLNLNYILALNQAVLTIDWDSLPTSREPVEERTIPRYQAAANDGQESVLAGWPTVASADSFRSKWPDTTPDLLDDLPDELEDETVADIETLRTFVALYPEEAVDILVDCEVTKEEVRSKMAEADFIAAFPTSCRAH